MFDILVAFTSHDGNLIVEEIEAGGEQGVRISSENCDRYTCVYPDGLNGVKVLIFMKLRDRVKFLMMKRSEDFNYYLRFVSRWPIKKGKQ